MNGEIAAWSQQVNALLADLGRRLEQLEARVARLDAHGGELAAEVLDVIERVDRLETKLSDRIERLGERADAHEDAHWRSGR